MNDRGQEKTGAQITLYTIGHSNHSWDEFLKLLRAYHISTLVDIRSYPYSTKFHHFDYDSLEYQLVHHEITYHWFKELGGLRKGWGEQSPNQGLKDEGLRNYADYMQTDVFKRVVGQLLTMACLRRTTIMCAEKDYKHCHRQLLCDYLTANDVNVIHIRSITDQIPHEWTKHAHVTEDGMVSYPGPDAGQGKLFE